MRPLDDIKRDAAAAEPGPWIAQHGDVEAGDATSWYVDAPERPSDFGGYTLQVATMSNGGDEATARFIAAARTDVPDLCAEVRRLRELLGEARPYVEAAMEAGGITMHDELVARGVLNRIDASLRGEL